MLLFDNIPTLTFFVTPNFRHNVKNENIQRIAVRVDTWRAIQLQQFDVISRMVQELWDAVTSFRNLKECVIVVPNQERKSDFDFTRELEPHIEKLRAANQSFDNMKFGHKSLISETLFRFPAFTRMTEMQFARVGEIVRKYWS